MNLLARVRRAMARLALAIWASRLAWVSAAGLKETLLQKVHPPRPLVPSRLGQVKPASRAILWMRSPWRRSRSCPKVLTLFESIIDCLNRSQRFVGHLLVGVQCA